MAQKIKIDYTEREKKMIDEMAFICSTYCLDRNNPPDLSFEQIQTICADAWEVEPEQLIGKINHNNDLDRTRKISLLWALCFYSNRDASDFAKFMGCSWSFASDGDRNGTSHLLHKTKHAPVFLKILQALDKKRKDRIFNLAKIDFDMIKGVTDASDTYSLTPEEIAKIPNKSLEWFYNNNTQFTMLAYSGNGKEVKEIIFSRTSDHKLLHRMQRQGYKFNNYFDAVDDILKKQLEISKKNLEEAKKLEAQVNELFKENEKSAAKLKMEIEPDAIPDLVSEVFSRPVFYCN